MPTFARLLEPANVVCAESALAETRFDAGLEIRHRNLVSLFAWENAKAGDNFTVAGNGDFGAGMFLQHFAPLFANFADCHRFHIGQYVRQATL